MIPTIGELFVRDVTRMQRARDRGDKVSVLYLHRKIIKKYACHISPRAGIAPTVSFPHPVGIVIVDGAIIDDNCVVYQHVTIGRLDKDIAEYPNIGSGCVLYSGSCVLGDAHLGAGTVVGANAVVLGGRYGAGATLVGLPARDVSGNAK